jgi:predicted nucleotidyltransferase
MNIDKIRKNFLSQQETDHRAKQLLDAVLAVCRPVSVILFGSAARYELTPSSDLDVVVVFSSKPDLKSAQKQLYAQSGTLPFAVDFLLVDSETYDKKSLVGGALFDARAEGRVLWAQGQPHPALQPSG